MMKALKISSCRGRTRAILFADTFHSYICPQRVRGGSEMQNAEKMYFCGTN